MKNPHRLLMRKIGVIKPNDSASAVAVKMSIAETAARAVVTATVTFAVGWLLKRMFEKTVEDANPHAPRRVKPSMAANNPSANYRAPSRRLPSDH